MSAATTFALALLLSALQPADAPTNEDGERHALACRLEAGPTTRRVGDSLRARDLRAWLVNRGTDSVVLPPLLDGSASGLRLPTVTLAIESESVGPFMTPGPLRHDLHVNGLRSTDFVELAPSEEVLLGAARAGSRVPWPFSRARLRASGEHVVRLTWSSKEDETRRWRIPSDATPEERRRLEALLASVPRVEVTCAVALTVLPREERDETTRDVGSQGR